jgi:tripartite-type tricarboxylate transporter receptor subunit TctC
MAGSRFLKLLMPVVVALALCVADAGAQALPDRPIKLINPYAPGGGADLIVRLLAQRIGAAGGPQIVVESRTGGGGVVAAMAAKTATADGTTLLVADIGPFATNPTLMSDLPYDPVKDFRPITLLFAFPSILTVPAASPARTVAELVDLARKTQGGLHYASQGPGSLGQILAEMFSQAIGAPLVHVPFRGGAPAAAEVAAGRVAMSFSSYLVLRPHVDGNAARMLAVTSRQRMPQLPQIPTLTETGYPQLAADAWFGLAAPAGTPDAFIRAFRELVVREMNSAEVRTRVEEQGFYVTTNTPEEFAALIQSDMARYGQIIKSAGIKAN